MEKVLVFCLVGCLIVLSTNAIKYRLGLHPPPINGDEVLPPDEWFTQRLDHYDPTNTNTWKQRYQTNATWYSVRRNAPVFLMIGGEGEASAVWMVKGAWLDYAKKYGALCFQLEHRFYGKSHPTADMSVENLKYLSSEQALADLAYFIQGMNEKYQLTRSNKWVVFGGSYPGSLAAWARMKFPHLIHAAVSTSGPLLAKTDFTEYFEVVTRSLNTYGSGCANAVQDAAKKVATLLKTNNGTEELISKFKLCNKIDPTNTDDVYTLFESLSNIYADVVQYNKDNRFTPSATSNITIDDICLTMTDPSIPDTLDRMATLSNMLIHLENEICLDFKYTNMIASMTNTSWESSASEGGRQWTYQTCTEFGFYQTSEKPTHLFGPMMPVDWYIKQCGDIYGKPFSKKLLDRDVYRTNNNYGALHIDVSRVIFVHGTIDPWHALGRTHSSDGRAPAILIEGTAHCANMYPPSLNDPPQLTAAREKISKYIGKWLMEGLET